MAGQTVVKQVTAQISADTKELDAALQRSEGKLKNTKREIESGGAAAGRVGTQYGNAARQIASATEAIARNGKITGESAKQILQQGSAIAFAFGPTGAIVGALSIFGLAVATAMGRARQELEDTAKKAEETIARLINAGDSEGLKARARELFVGTAADRDKAGNLAPFSRGITGRRAEIAALEAEIAKNPAFSGRQAREVSRLKQELAVLETEYQKVTEALLNFTRPLETRTAPAIRVTAQTTQGAAKDIAELERAFERAATEGARAIAAFDKEATDFGKAFDAVVLREIGTEADRVADAFDRLIEQGKRTVGASDPRIQQLEQLRDTAVAAARAAELKDRLEKLKKPAQESARGVADIAREIQQAVDGALQLAAAFGAIDANASTALRSIAQIAGNIPALQTAISAGSGLGIISASLPILGAFASLLGDSPAEAARREELRANTEAIRELTKRAGLLGIGVAGSNAASAQLLLQDFLGRAAGGQIIARGRTYSAADQATIAAERLGILDDLQAVAAEYGITLNRNIESFQQLADALADTITKLGEFGTDLESALQQASAEAEIFGITDPLGRLGLTTGALGGRSPAFDALLNGLDLNTAEGRAEARRRAQDLFTVLRAGGDTLDPAALGGLTGQQLLDAILELVRGLNAADEALGVSTGTQVEALQVSANTQITADQASRLLGLNATQVTLQREIRDLLASALQAAATPLPVPSAAVFAAPTAGGGTVYITIENVFNAPVTDAASLDARQLATITEHIRRELGVDVRVRRQYSGKAGVS